MKKARKLEKMARMDDVIEMASDLSIQRLGKCTVRSPLRILVEWEGVKASFVRDSEKVLFDPTSYTGGVHQKPKEATAVELAGPREKIFFDPSEVRAAIVTCGGLCPGINDVIRGLVMTLYYRYGVTDILGILYGYRGFIPRYGYGVRKMTPQSVSEIHKWGGTILGSSRGPQDSGQIMDFLEKENINVLFVIGGDGSMRGALDIIREVERRKRKVSVIGIPKTVDNDILYIDKSFGFETAFSEAVHAISSAHTESKGAPNGIGLVKLMGRHSGFIACSAALAMNDVNFVLIPEILFRLEGPDGFLKALQERLKKRRHAVIVVAEGAGQDLFEVESAKDVTDASGNTRLRDIGLCLKGRIDAYFKEIGMEVNLKYIDPSYIIRSIPASPQDSIYCLRLAEYAAHAAMCGRTKMVVGRRNGFFVHLPMDFVASGRKHVNPRGFLWQSVLSATGQTVRFFHN